MRKAPTFLLVLLALGVSNAWSQVVISEIHYHPYEKPVFFSNGAPALDYTEDVHEFVEVHNRGTSSMDLSGWQLSDGVEFVFPPGTTIAPGGYRVVGKTPPRIASVYSIQLSEVLGPYIGQLSNDRDTVRLKNADGAIIDVVNYSSRFPWSVSADGLGAGQDFLGYNPLNPPYSAQFKGRSLERVSVTGSSNDPGNWIASPWPGQPSPGLANSAAAAVNNPVVRSVSVVQQVDEAAVIRAAQPVRITCDFTSLDGIVSVELEYWVDEVESFAEARTTIAMTSLPGGQFTAVIPGHADRNVVRYRIKANGSSGLLAISPRADDPAMTPVSATTREAWHAYFVTPVRTSNRPIYEFFISTANTSTLTTNITQTPRRTTPGDPPGYPRDEPFVLPPDPQWNGMVPAVFVSGNRVFDVAARFHGSRYRRSAGLNSWKIHFPNSRLFEGMQQILVTEKGDDGILGFELFRRAGLYAAYSRYVDFYRNNEPVTRRLEFTDSDEETFERWAEEKKMAYPDTEKEPLGLIYKSKGQDFDEGPYGFAHGRPMATRTAGPLVPGGQWISRLRYEWSYPLQTSDWKGYLPFEQMLNGMWTARGDVSNPGINTRDADLRTWLNANWDVDWMLTYLAIKNWGCPWDDIFHNYYVWRRGNGKWVMAPWDFDSEFSGQSATTSIFVGKIGDPSNNFRGPNYFKDSVLRAFPNEYRERMLLLNNTLLHPTNVQAIAAERGISVNSSWLTARFDSVNSQCGLGVFERPTQPTNVTPSSGDTALPPTALTASAYTHSAPTPLPHTSTRWEIRSAQGSYKEPLFAVTSTTHLTSLPIPFEQLTFGGIYHWRCTYYDSKGRPSPTSAETSFVFGQQPVTRSLVAIDATTQWRYNQTANLDGVKWTARGYDDSQWASGPALLYVEGAALPATKRTLLTIGRNTYYFRSKFNVQGNTQGATLRLKQIVDDGLVVYLNGVEVWRTGLPSGPVSYATTASRTVGDAVYEPATGWFTIPAGSLVSGENVIAAEVHQNDGASSDVVFGLALEGDLPNLSGELVINEVLAVNENGVTNAGRHSDWIELFNASLSPINLGGMSLSDDVLVPGRFVFPAGTTIPALGYLVIWCDREFTAPGLHTGFGLSRNGQTLALFSGQTVKDFVTFGPQIADLSIGRSGTGGPFGLTIPTPGAANTAKTPLGSPAGLRINEWMASPTSGEDWLELFNPGTDPVPLEGLHLSDSADAPRLSPLPPLSFVAGGGFVLFEADGTSGGNHANFKLSAGGESIVLTSNNGGTTVDSVAFGAQLSGVSQGRLPDGSAAALVSFPQTQSPEASNYLPAQVLINELLSSSSGALEDAMELYNSTGAPIDISSWWLSDDRQKLKKFQLPAGTTVPAGGYRVLYENQFNPTPGQGDSFSFSSLGEQVILSAVNGSGELTGFRNVSKFGAAAEGVSFGRVVTSNGSDFFPQIARTFGQDTPSTVAEFRTGAGAPNAGPRIGPIVINEVAYHPVDSAGGVDNVGDEFIELHNIAANPQDVGGWVLKDSVDFIFPPGTVIRAGEYVLVVGFDPTQPNLLSGFRTRNNVPASVPVIGPFAPKLPNSSATVELARIGPPVEGETPEILVDRLRYSDVSPWPNTADGTGPSLQRISRTAFGNDPVNWSASAATPGRVNVGQPPIFDSDGDGVPDTWEASNGLDPYGPADATDDSDGDGQTNRAEFIAGTDPQDGTNVLSVEVSPTANGLRVRIPVRIQKTYTIQYKVSLGEATWTKLMDVPEQPADGVFETVDPAPGAQRFYRVITPAAP